MQSVTSNAVAVALDSSISEAITQLKNSMYLQTQKGINVTFEGLASYACGLLMCTQQGVGSAIFCFHITGGTPVFSALYAPSSVAFGASYSGGKLTITSGNGQYLRITIVYTTHP